MTTRYDYTRIPNCSHTDSSDFSGMTDAVKMAGVVTPAGVNGIEMLSWSKLAVI